MSNDPSDEFPDNGLLRDADGSFVGFGNLLGTLLRRR